MAIAIFEETAINKIKQSKNNKSYKETLISKIKSNDGISGRIRDFKSHANSDKLSHAEIQFKNELIRKKLISYLMLVIENFCYQGIGIDSTYCNQMIDNKLKLLR